MGGSITAITVTVTVCFRPRYDRPRLRAPLHRFDFFLGDPEEGGPRNAVDVQLALRGQAVGEIRQGLELGHGGTIGEERSLLVDADRRQLEATVVPEGFQ